MKRCLITGGAGYIGTRLADHVLRTGATVTLLDNLHRGSPGVLPLIEGDVRDESALLNATRGIDVVFHLAAESAVLSADADPEYCFSTNVTGTFRLLRAAQANGVRRVVFASSREVYGDAAQLPVSESAPLRPKNAYGASKAAAEMCCAPFANLGIEISIVRMANVYGPGDHGRVIPRFVESAIHGLPLTLFGGTQLIDFVWIDHVVEALASLGLGPHIPGPLNLACGQGTPITALAERIIAESGSSSTLTIAPSNQIEVSHFVADISAARAALGFPAPEDPLFGLSQVIAAARA